MTSGFSWLASSTPSFPFTASPTSLHLFIGLQDQAQAFTHDEMVILPQNPDWRTHQFFPSLVVAGNVTLKMVPFPGWLSTFSVPPASLARSRIPPIRNGRSRTGQLRQ